MTLATVFTKFANLFLRVFLSRIAGTETLGSYLMVLPLIFLIINIAQAGVPSSLFTLISKDKQHQKHLLYTSFKLCLIQFIIMGCILFICHDYFSLLYPYLTLIIIFVFVACVDALLRSYFLGNEKGHIPALSQVLEECIRLFTLFMIYFKKNTLTLHDALFAMLLGEFFACIFMSINSRIQSLKTIAMPNPYKEILSISIPTSMTTLINAFCRSLEPLIFKNGLIKLNYTPSQINTFYGILNGCVFSVLLIPTFLNNVIYRILLPKLSNCLHLKKRVQNLLLKSMLLCLMMGLPFSIIFLLFPSDILQLLFKSSQGDQYLRYLALPFLFFYLQTPLQAYMQVTKKQKHMVVISIIQTIISLSILYVCMPTLGPASLIYSFLSTIIINTILPFFIVYHDLFFNKE